MNGYRKWDTRTMEHYQTEKRILSFATTWPELQVTTFSQTSPAPPDKGYQNALFTLGAERGLPDVSHAITRRSPDAGKENREGQRSCLTDHSYSSPE